MAMLASKHNDVKLLEKLVDAGATLQGCDDDGNDALMWAVIHKNRGIVQYLLSKGFNPNFPPVGSVLSSALPTVGGAGSFSDSGSAKPWLPPLHVAALAGDMQVALR
jgi:ankyrin repeat protein